MIITYHPLNSSDGKDYSGTSTPWVDIVEYAGNATAYWNGNSFQPSDGEQLPMTWTGDGDWMYEIDDSNLTADFQYESICSVAGCTTQSIEGLPDAIRSQYGAIPNRRWRGAPNALRQAAYMSLHGGAQ